jgi:hypothetical protein
MTGQERVTARALLDGCRVTGPASAAGRLEGGGVAHFGDRRRRQFRCGASPQAVEEGTRLKTTRIRPCGAGTGAGGR